MDGCTSSADFTYRLYLGLHALRAGAGATEVTITVNDWRGVEGPGTEAFLDERDTLSDYIGVCRRAQVVCKLSEQPYIVWNEGRMRLKSEQNEHAVC